MHLLTANEAKARFGEILLKAQREPVHISKHGKPVAVLVAAEDFVSNEELKLELLQLRAERARDQINAGETVDGGEFFDQLLQESDD
ncbi:type II toxin-antitoxin system Phd/YefM family antitoxin [Denitrificimonas caeni]|uniref:Antitoxin n=1 Tax=Denitrificimonas caeni TaxID=521720 RepID=A0AAF0AKS7_9GAMM|nr:type II toxin-antitoxin system Phd/YefM family antitoxin [Denitrificimonas caeni]WBE24763.1 type II toxin-antitoxin system Phd/YefM family antitoxin [Denitrificimonas caeni]